MAHREIVDPGGVLWEVWEVRPTLAERRLGSERRTVARHTPERRTHKQKRAALATELRQGWLAFQCKTERRRSTPIPNSWSGMEDSELLGVLSLAQPAKPPRRLIE